MNLKANLEGSHKNQIKIKYKRTSAKEDNFENIPPNVIKNKTKNKSKEIRVFAQNDSPANINLDTSNGFSSNKHNLRISSIEMSEDSMTSLETVKKDYPDLTNLATYRKSSSTKLKENLDEMPKVAINNITMDGSTENTEKVMLRRQEYEQYKGDIQALKKRLDFINLSSSKLFSSSAKSHASRHITNNKTES